jgi:hypothetical protein
MWSRLGCGNLPSIDNGNITLSNENDFSYEATAEVTCDSGYKTDTPIISCQANGSWTIAKCTEKRKPIDNNLFSPVCLSYLFLYYIT